MKAKQLFFGLALMAGSLVGCNDDDNTYTPSQQVLNTFENMYPNATKIDWEQKLDYSVADFRENGREVEVWIDATGTWVMTETDLLYEDLPAAVKSGFEASEYASWKRDDVDKLERLNMDVVYVIEVEQSGKDLDLYFDEEGTLLKTVEDDPTHTPSTLPESVKNFIADNYPGSTIKEVEYIRGNWEVDIRHNNLSKEVLFDGEYNWISTSWDVRQNEVPAVVLNTIQTRYSDYKIDDIEFEERATNVNVYVFELEKSGSPDIYVTVDTEGNIVE